MVDGAFCLVSLLLGLAGALVSGNAGDLLTPRVLLVVVGFLVTGIGCLAVGQRILHRSRPALWAGLEFAALIAVALLVFLATYPWTTDEGGGAGYVLLGGVMTLGLNSFIVFHTTRALRDGHWAGR